MSPEASATVRVAVVTGASGGLGRTVMEQFVRRGISAVGLSRHDDTTASIWRCDVSHEEEVRLAFERIQSERGRLDILVNCAAVVSTADDLSLSVDEWNRVLAINVVGSYLCCRYAAEIMRTRRYGRIVNVSSIAARSYSRTASVAYTASKYAIIGLTRQLAARLAVDGITVNCVAPSQFETPMLMTNVPAEVRIRLGAQNPAGRLGQPDDVASAIAFLAGDEASYVNGAVLDVNGGQ